MAKVKGHLYNGSALNRLMKKEKSQTFLYQKGTGFCNGYLLLADNEQMESFVKNEFLNDESIYARYGKRIQPIDFVSMLKWAEDESIEVTQSNFKYYFTGSDTMCDVFISKKDNKPYVFNEKFTKLIYNINQFKLFISRDALIVKKHNHEFVAMILRMRLDDDKEHGVIQNIMKHPLFKSKPAE